MARDDFQERTEKATPKKREKAREEGQVARSMEIPSVLVLMAGMIGMYFGGYFLFHNISGALRHSFSFQSIPAGDFNFFLQILYRFSKTFFLIVLPVMSAVLVTALVANLVQVGFKLSAKAITPKLSRFNIVNGFKRLFSVRSLVELIKSILKLTLIGITAYLVIKSQVGQMMNLYDTSIANILLFVLKGIFRFFMAVLLAMILLAILDYAFQRWQFEKDIRMTKQEVKEEHKQAEGDPLVKSRIRNIQYQIAQRRMMQEVPEADVVVTNPTHLALAIRYDQLSMSAPQVVAKGAGNIAERIKDIANEQHIPVIENKELALNLYNIVEVGQEIPSQFFMAVAELLAYVYKLKGKSI